MPGDITEVKIVDSDITEITETTDITTIVETQDITVISSASATLNVSDLGLATSANMPQDIGREASLGVSNLAARADHVHSGASLLLDGGNY